MYKLIKNPDGGQSTAVLRDGKDSIPFDPANTDYQAFLLWKAQGNEPLPADEPQV
jgi:hypothetical protein